MINSDLLNRERDLFFMQTQGGVYLPLIGIVFWPTLGLAGFWLSPQTWCLTVLCLFVVVLPASIIVFKRIAAKLLLKSPLASLILPSMVPVVMSFGITLPVYYVDLSLVPLTLVLSLAFHWPVIGWLYNQPVFIIHAIVRMLVALSMWYFFPQHLFTWLPIAVGFLYLITAWCLLRNLHQLKLTTPQINAARLD